MTDSFQERAKTRIRELHTIMKNVTEALALPPEAEGAVASALFSEGRIADLGTDDPAEDEVEGLVHRTAHNAEQFAKAFGLPPDDKYVVLRAFGAEAINAGDEQEKDHENDKS